MKTKVVNLLGGYGLGKSTTAALVFGELKLAGESAELVREYAKERAWAGRKVGPADQGIIYGNQLERESLLYGKVDYLITDSPLILCAIYQQFYNERAPIESLVFKDLAHAKDKGVEHVNLLLKRNKAYDPRGRYETEDQAKQVDKFVEVYLREKNIDFQIVTEDDRERVTKILEIITKENNNGI